MSRVSIAPAGDQEDELEIDLWGDIFRRRTLTKPRKRKYVEALAGLERQAIESDKAIEALDPSADDYVASRVDIEMAAEAEMVAAAGALFDQAFEYVGDAERAPKPSTVLRKRYDAGKVSWGDIDGFLDRLTGAAIATPPTGGGRDD